MQKVLNVSAFCFAKDNFKLLGFSYQLCFIVYSAYNITQNLKNNFLALQLQNMVKQT